MAKLNWQRCNEQSLIQTTREAEYQRNRQALVNQKRRIVTGSKYWHIGTHKGKQVSSLPLDYLCFVSETFDNESPHKARADRELRRRYNATQKVSRPD
tara:strand:- start:12 stop:305 length:294 start_codon:yes stop_codon:yes gene_type:complete